MPSDCVFCKIIRKEIPAHIVFEDERSIAFLDQRPLFAGHVLLCPREHHETIQEIPAELIAPLFANAQILARAVEKGMQAEGIFVGINNKVSQSVPHLHVHIVPRRSKDGLRGFFWPRTKYESDADAARARDAILAALE